MKTSKGTPQLKKQLMQNPKFKKVWQAYRRRVSYFRKKKHKHEWEAFLFAVAETRKGYDEVPLVEMCEKCEKTRKVKALKK